MLTYSDIAKLTGIPRPLLRQWQRRGKMPPPDARPSPRVPLWEEETIKKWMENHDEK